MVATREEDGYICIINAFGRYRDVVDAVPVVQVNFMNNKVTTWGNYFLM